MFTKRNKCLLGETMEIKVPEKFRKEVQEQFIGDMEYEGFNRELLLLEYLKETFGMEEKGARVE